MRNSILNIKVPDLALQAVRDQGHHVPVRTLLTFLLAARLVAPFAALRVHHLCDAGDLPTLALLLLLGDLLQPHLHQLHPIERTLLEVDALVPVQVGAGHGQKADSESAAHQQKVIEAEAVREEGYRGLVPQQAQGLLALWQPEGVLEKNSPQLTSLEARCPPREISC